MKSVALSSNEAYPGFVGVSLDIIKLNENSKIRERKEVIP